MSDLREKALSKLSPENPFIPEVPFSTRAEECEFREELERGGEYPPSEMLRMQVEAGLYVAVCRYLEDIAIRQERLSRGTEALLQAFEEALSEGGSQSAFQTKLLDNPDTWDLNARGFLGVSALVRPSD